MCSVNDAEGLRCADQIQEAFKKDPEPFKGHVNEISLAMLDAIEDVYLSSGLGFIWKMSKVYPEV